MKKLTKRQLDKIRANAKCPRCGASEARLVTNWGPPSGELQCNAMIGEGTRKHMCGKRWDGITGEEYPYKS